MVQTFHYTSYQNWKVVLHCVIPISLFGSLCHADHTIKGKFPYKENFFIRRISFFKKSKIGFSNFKKSKIDFQNFGTFDPNGIP
jgi:hypothetical protein